MRLPPAFAVALALVAPASAEPGPTSDTVVVKGRKPVVVVAATCPQPDPARYPAAAAPKVVDSYPRPGAVAPPGATRVRITFDAPMSCFSEVMVDGPDDPCSPTGGWDVPARRSWVMHCRLRPGTEYVFSFRRIDGQGFVGLSGRRAEPYRLAFTTGVGDPTVDDDAAARLDPGPPQPSPSYGVVTCTDTGPGGGSERDCRRSIVMPARPAPSP